MSNESNNGQAEAEKLKLADSVSATRVPRKPLWVAALLLACAGVIIYARTIGWLWQAWTTEPDYSHGPLVPIFALAMAWMRREKAPPFEWEPSARSLILFGLAAGILLLAGWVGVDALLGWSLVFWIGGLLWLFGGDRWMRHHAQYVAFLLLAVPLPYRFERALSLPLQTIATHTSCWILQALTLPAIAEGHTILLHDVRLEVVQACSGLRMFVGVTALAFAFLILFVRPWWYRVTLLMAVLPIAILSNAFRIVSSAVLYQWFTSSGAREWIHDLSGWMMIVVATLLFYGLTVYLDNLFVEVRPYEVRAPKKRRRTATVAQDETSIGAKSDA